jgi:MtN3 and saliva related transmembrane protein
MILEFMTTVAGIASTMSFFFQTYKIIKRKSAEDVSRPMYYTIMPCVFIWLAYGIQIHSIPIIATEVVMLVAASSILICSFIYAVKPEKITAE